MTSVDRRTFFKSFFSIGAALTASGTLGHRQAEATEQCRISGICLYVPSLGKAADFVELMQRNAPGDWRVEALQGSFDERYFQTRELYQRARSTVNTLVGVVDPASFTMINEAVVASGGSFHYVTYEERGRVTFSVRL